MRHRRATRRLGRNLSGKKALIRSLLRALLISERISTTCVKAKEASSFADRLISLGKKNTSTARKTAIEILGSKLLINKLFNDIAPRYGNRNGGYTRVIQLSNRKGDGAKMAFLELTERKIVEKKVKKSADKKETQKEAAALEKKEERPLPKKEEKAVPQAPPRPVAIKEKPEEKKGKERFKSEKGKLRKNFFKDFFRRKSI